MLTPCRSKVAFVFDTWSPAEARSWPFFIFRLPAKAKSQSFKFVNVDPLQKQGHICFWHLIPCRSKVLAIIYFFDSLQKQSHSHLNLLMVTPYRSKVTFVFGTWSPAEARSWPLFIFWLPAEAKSKSFKFVEMLTPCRSNVAFVLALDLLQKQGLGHSLFFWLPAEAKSQSFKFVNVDPLQKQGHICFWHLISYRSKVLAILYFSSPCRSKVTVI